MTTTEISANAKTEEDILRIRRIIAGPTGPYARDMKELDKAIELAKATTQLKDWVKPVEAIVAFFRGEKYAPTIGEVLRTGNEQEKKIMETLEGYGHGF